MLILPDLTEYDEESAGLERTLDAAAENGVPMYVALDGDTFALGSGTLTVLAGPGKPRRIRTRRLMPTICPFVCGIRREALPLWIPGMQNRKWNGSW